MAADGTALRRGAPLTCVAADVDPQRAVAGELLSAVRADLLFLPRVCLAETWQNRHVVDVMKNICSIHPHILPTLQSEMWPMVKAGLHLYLNLS